MSFIAINHLLLHFLLLFQFARMLRFPAHVRHGMGWRRQSGAEREAVQVSARLEIGGAI
jgi:hypothetical protein